MQFIRVNYITGNKTITDMQIIADVSQYDINSIASLDEAIDLLQQSIDRFTNAIGAAKSNLSQSTYRVEQTNTAIFISRINMITDKAKKIVGFELKQCSNAQELYPLFKNINSP